MKLHEDKLNFERLISLVSEYKNIPELAIRKDYYIVEILNVLSRSEYKDVLWRDYKKIL